MGYSLKILVDGIHITQEMKGVGRYVLNTLQEIQKLNADITFEVIILNQSTPPAFLELAHIRWLPVTWINHLWHGFWTLPKVIHQTKPDIIWIPYETPVANIKQPYTILCHDIPIQLREAQKHEYTISIRKNLLNWLDDKLLERSLRKASVVFSNSYYVANWLKDQVKVEHNNIKIAPCAPGTDFHSLSLSVDTAQVYKKLNTPNGYILVIYTGDPRENFDVVPTIYEYLVDQKLPQALVIVGVRPELHSELDKRLSKFTWYDRVRLIPFLGIGQEHELASLYTAAVVYLDTSLQEGFGMQIIEAMACGTPVVCSNRGALPEVSGNAAILIDPMDTRSIAESIYNLLNDKALEQTLIQRGYHRASQYTWKQTAAVIYQGLTALAPK